MFFQRQKKGQIAIFLLISIVLVSGFSIFYFVFNNAHDAQTSVEREATYIGLLQQSSIKESINSCLDMEVVRGLNFIGKQGGVIYKDQGGFIDEGVSIDHGGFKVNYGILRREPNAEFYPLPVPDYPYIGKLENQNKAYYGKENIANLCEPFGDNKNCPSLDVFGKSFEKQLKVYIINGTRKCLESTVFSQAFPNYNISLSEQPNVTVVFGEGKVIFDFKTRISFLFSGNVLSGVENFKIIKNVRMKNFHNFIKDLINNEIKDIKFDIEKDYKKLKTVKTGFKVSKIKNACSGCDNTKKYDDIIIVSDSNSELDGKPYTFIFTRQNRIPALDLIKQQGLELETDYDIRVEEGKEIIIKPIAYDPDEETNLKMLYSGWMETENVVYNLDTENYEKVTNPDKPFLWTGSKLYEEKKPNANYTTSLKDIGHHVVKVKVIDRQKLEDYQNIKIFVYDKPRFEIWGENEFSVAEDIYASTEDPYTLRADVDCIFCEAKNEFENIQLQYKFFGYPYADDDEYFVLKTNERTYELDKDIDDPFVVPFANQSDMVKLFIPTTSSVQVPYSDLFVTSCFPFQEPGTAPYPYNGVDFSRISYAPAGKYIKIVPDDEPFLATHACCSGNMQLSGRVDPRWQGGSFVSQNTNCFDINYETCNPYYLLAGGKTDNLFYSKIKSADESGKLSLYPRTKLNFSVDLDSGSGEELYSSAPFEEGGVGELELQRILSTENGKYLNDIFTRTFEQKCSGNRGNACAGKVTQHFELTTECDDRDIFAGEDESCFGVQKTRVTKDNCLANSLGCNLYNSVVIYKADLSIRHEVLRSFEQNFLKFSGNSNLNQEFDHPFSGEKIKPKINGVCNEKYREAIIDFSSRKGKFESGGVWLCQAVCGTDKDDNKGCTVPYFETCLCNVQGNACYGYNPKDLDPTPMPGASPRLCAVECG